ncbi:unnamed protein product, partial [Mesorhabditis belari]|uniref:Protein kinase domain-containing protein n=1 Tax=Mesorhabditis belari TaxID=2138241 RepID=A0AAF3F6G0_9BILA
MATSTRYAHPVISKEENEESHRNDVYSVGLMLWEIIERKVVFDEYDKNGHFCRDLLVVHISSGEFSQEQLYANTEDSHRNDVYSLGLVIWEMIERKKVLSQYTSGNEFQRDLFLVDIALKRITALEPPGCQEAISVTVQRCTNFNRNSRPTGQEVLKELKENKQIFDSVNMLEFMPQSNIERKERICPYKVTRQDYLPAESDEKPEPQFVELLSGTNLEPFKAILKSLLKQEKDKDDFFGIKEISKNPKKYRPLLMANVYGRNEEFRLDGFIKSDSNSRRKGLNQAFRCLQVHHFKKFLNILGCNRCATLNPWSRYQENAKAIRVWEELRMLPFLSEIWLKFYVEKTTGQKWFLLDENLGQFVTEDFSVVKEFENQFLVHEKAGENSLPFLQMEVLKPTTIIEILKENLENMMIIGKCFVEEHIRLEDSRKNLLEARIDPNSPIPGYVFQLRNPPREFCGQRKRQLERFEPFKEFYLTRGRKFDPFPVGMLVFYYKEASKESLDYLELYFHFLSLFERTFTAINVLLQTRSVDSKGMMLSEWSSPQKGFEDCDSGSLRGYDWSYYVFAYHVLNWHETLDHDFNLFLLDNWINPNFFWCQLYWAISGVTYMFVNIMVIWWAFERLKRSRNLLNDSARKRHFFAIVALIIQAIVPLVGYVIPLYIFSILAQTRLERNLQEPTSVFVVMLSTHGALNALVMMMVTKPYRRFLVANLKRVALCKADGRIYGASSGQLWSE